MGSKEANLFLYHLMAPEDVFPLDVPVIDETQSSELNLTNDHIYP